MAGRPDDLRVGIHLCRVRLTLPVRPLSTGQGNYLDGRHFSEGAYDRIAKKLFVRLRSLRVH